MSTHIAHAHDTGHSHDGGHGHSHGLISASIKRSKAGLRAVSLSLVVLLVTSAAQAVVFALTSSVALLADLIHNFGDALTALGGNDVLRVPIDGGSAELPIPYDFRVIGTLNSFDRNYLNQISEALKRRFSFIEILPPTRQQR